MLLLLLMPPLPLLRALCDSSQQDAARSQDCIPPSVVTSMNVTALPITRVPRCVNPSCSCSSSAWLQPA